MNPTLQVLSGTSNPELSQDIAKHLGTRLGPAKIGRFSDGEIRVEVDESVRGNNVFVVQSLCPPVNANLMELLIIIDALKRSSAGRITAVIPYLGYARQDRQSRPRTPITAKLVADLIKTAGADAVVCMDIHANQIQGFFGIPVDLCHARGVLVREIKEVTKEHEGNLVVISPDAGGVDRARSFATRLNASLAIVDKRRPQPNESKVMHIIGKVEGKVAVIADDMIDTAGTLTETAKVIKAEGALAVYSAATHGVFSGPALERISESCLEKVIITDTIPMTTGDSIANDKILRTGVGFTLSDVIERIHGSLSVSCAFEAG